MDLLGLGSKLSIEFLLDPKGQRKQIEVKSDDSAKRSSQYIYYDGEDVDGIVGRHTCSVMLSNENF